MHIKRLLTGLITALAVLVSGFVAAPQAHADTLISDQQSITKAADWMKTQWEAGKYGTDVGLLADGIMALSSAKQHRSTVDAMLAQLKRTGPAYVTNRADALAKVILTADMAGVSDPAHFFGKDRDLAAELIAYVNAEKVDQAWGGYLTVIALERIGRLKDVSPAGMTYLMGTMNATPDGGFGWKGQTKGDPDYTGVGVSAMFLLTKSSQVSSSVKTKATKQLADAKKWAANSANQRKNAQGEYYWIAVFNGTDGASSNSTGMLASALNEAGVNTETPKRAMKREQAATKSGAAWSNIYGGRKDDLRGTTQAIFAITGTGYATAKFPPAVKVTKLTLPASLTLAVGASQTLTPTVAPSNATTKSVTWASSNKAIATVDAKGKVTAVKAGTATITATAADGSGVKASTKVTASAAPFDVYTTPGVHSYNGRLWNTKCENYSPTVVRCTTDIQATVVSYKNGTFVESTGWVFNNLTYKPSSRSMWTKNPLAAYGKVGGKVSWTAEDGRKWRTECDTASTGRGGCRSYATAQIIESYTASNGKRQYRWVTKEIFNNIVRFS